MEILFHDTDDWISWVLLKMAFKSGVCPYVRGRLLDFASEGLPAHIDRRQVVERLAGLGYFEPEFFEF